ncbi:MAG TPA: DUF4386 domain-containing protein [Ktedonobacteraceae bacterium]|jgi:hypothetical protein
MHFTTIPAGQERKGTPAGSAHGSDISDPTAGKSTTNAAQRTKRIVSANQRRAEIVIAALFLVTAAASIPGAFVLDHLLNVSDYLARVYPQKDVIAWGSLLWSINNIGIVFIAVFVFGLLRKLDATLAAGYLACRIIEGTIMMLGVAATFLLIPLSQQYLQAGAPQGSWFLSMGAILKQARFLGLSGLSLPILGLGGLLFSWMLLRFRLVGRAICVVGLIGYAVVLCGSIAGWFGLIDVAPGSNGTIFALPVATFEIILLPLWLLFKGFKLPETPAHIAATK